MTVDVDNVDADDDDFAGAAGARVQRGARLQSWEGGEGAIVNGNLHPEVDDDDDDDDVDDDVDNNDYERG